MAYYDDSSYSAPAASTESFFVGNLPYSVTEDQLASYFEGFGCGDVSVMMKTHRDGQPKGFAIVSMAGGCGELILPPVEHEIEGRRLNVRADRFRGDAPSGGGGSRAPAPDSAVLHVSSLAWETSDDSLFDFFSGFSAPQTATVQVHADSGRSKGWGLVTFDDVAAAKEALSAFGTVNQELDGRQIRAKMDRGRPPRGSGGGGGRSGGNRRKQQQYDEDPMVPVEGGECSLVVTNLPWSATDAEVNEMFAMYGVVSAEIIVGRDGRSRGYARVTTNSPQNANAAIAELNGVDFEGRPVRVKFDRLGSGAAVSSGGRY